MARLIHRHSPLGWIIHNAAGLKSFYAQRMALPNGLLMGVVPVRTGSRCDCVCSLAYGCGRSQSASWAACA